MMRASLKKKVQELKRALKQQEKLKKIWLIENGCIDREPENLEKVCNRFKAQNDFFEMYQVKKAFENRLIEKESENIELASNLT